MISLNRFRVEHNVLNFKGRAVMKIRDEDGKKGR